MAIDFYSSKTPSTRTALLKGLTFALDPKLDRSRKDLENAITKFGGSAVEKVNLKTAAVISNKSMHCLIFNDYKEIII